VCTTFEVRSFTRSSDNWVAKKFQQSLDMPTLHFLQNFSWAFVRMDPVNVPANFKFVALPVPEIIATGVLGGGCEPPILGKRRT